MLKGNIKAPRALGRGFEIGFCKRKEYSLIIYFNTLAVFESKKRLAHIAQVVEHFLGKEEVTGSSPVMSSR